MVNVCYCSDINYIPIMCASIKSVLEHNKNVNLYVFLDSHAMKNKYKIEELVSNYNTCNLNIILIPDDLIISVLHSAFSSEYNNFSQFYRLLIPYLLFDIDRILYLDGDTIIETDLNELFNYDLENNICGAIKDPFQETIDECYQKGIVKNPNNYINSGVLLIDLIKWKKDNSSVKIIQYLKNNVKKCRFKDQDGINFVLENKIKIIPRIEWNLMPIPDWRYENFKLDLYSKRIMHLTLIKPWMTDFEDYRDMPKCLSEMWKKYCFQKPSIMNRVKTNKPEKLLNLENEIANLVYQYMIESVGYNSKRFNGAVQYGPFKGLKLDYTKLISDKDHVAFSCAVKLSGLCESDLNDWIIDISKANYDVIINIGAAEGQYACGLAKLCPNSTVIAFEMDNVTAVHLKDNIRLNNLKNVIVEGICNSNILMNTLNKYKNEKILIFIDAEGDEYTILDNARTELLNNCDIICELHNFIIPGTTEELERRYSNTHNIEIKRQGSRNPHEIMELAEEVELFKWIYMSEFRPETMEWMRLLIK